MTRTWKLTRRKFFIGMGILSGGLALGIPIGLPYLRRSVFEFLSSGSTPAGVDGNPQLWFEFSEDNLLHLYVPKVEMGQGVHTALGQIAAEELELPWQNVRVHQAGTLVGPVDSFGTAGSSSVSGLYSPLRQLAANYRVMLTEAAEELTGTRMRLIEGIFVASESTEEVTLAEAARLDREWDEPQEDAPLRSSDKFRIIGQSVARVDVKTKLTAEPVYAYDMSASSGNTYFGAVARPRVVGATAKQVSKDVAVSMPRVVQVVIRDDLIAVVAETREDAWNAVDAMEIEWDYTQTVDQSDIESILDPDSDDAIEVKHVGDPERSFTSSEEVIVAEYSTPMAATAPLEPQSSFAHMDGDGIMRVRTPTQFPNQTAQAVADALGLDQERVDVTPTYLGGGFGRRQRVESAVEAAILAFETSLPVHVGWTREEEFFLDRFRPPTKHKMRAVLGDDGHVLCLEHRQSSGDVLFSDFPSLAASVVGSDFAATRGMNPIYGIPNISLYAHRADLPISTSAWRGLGLLANTFATESFIDELAVSAGKDPLSFRIEHLTGEVGHRVSTVLDSVAGLASWPGVTDNGSAMGVACCVDYGTVVAQIAQVKVENESISVTKIWAVMDAGLVVNPDGAINQVQGNIIWGLGSALKEAIVFKEGKPVARNFDGYPLLRMDEVPEIVVDLVPGDRPPKGVGEPAIGPVPAAVANAVFAATGVRIRDLPLTL